MYMLYNYGSRLDWAIGLINHWPKLAMIWNRANCLWPKLRPSYKNISPTSYNVGWVTGLLVVLAWPNVHPYLGQNTWQRRIYKAVPSHVHASHSKYHRTLAAKIFSFQIWNSKTASQSDSFFECSMILCLFVLRRMWHSECIVIGIFLVCIDSGLTKWYFKQMYFLCSWKTISWASRMTFLLWQIKGVKLEIGYSQIQRSQWIHMTFGATACKDLIVKLCLNRQTLFAFLICDVTIESASFE